MIDLRVVSVEAARHTSLADQAAALRRLCGHARGELSLVDECGFRFYAMPSGELPSFLNRRVELADGRSASITLLAGLDETTGAPALDECESTEDARRALAEGRGGTWLVRVTVGNATVGWHELSASLARSDPAAFSGLAGELLALPLNRRRSCPLCKLT